MKQSLLWVLILLLCVSAVSCKTEETPAAPNDEENKAAQEQDETQAPSGSEPETEGGEQQEGEPISYFDDGSVNLDYFYKWYHTSTIIEDEETIYFGKENGLWKQRKADREQALLFEADHVDSLLLKEDFLYFTAEEYSQVFRMNLNSGDVALIFDAAQSIPPEMSNPTRVSDYDVVDDVLYVIDTFNFFAYDIETQTFADCLPQYDPSSKWIILDNTLYYISHVKETFCLYEHNLSNSKTRVLYGEDVEFPEEELYYDFYFGENGLYLCQRMPQGLYYISGRDKTIISDGYVYSLAEIDGILYFLDEYGLSGYDPVEKKHTYHSYLKENWTHSNGFAVVDSYVYYCMESLDGTTYPCAEKMEKN